MLNNVNFNNILLISDYKRTFWEEVKYQVEDLFSVVIDFFEGLYSGITGILGTDITNLFLIALAALIVMLVAMAIINR